MLCRLLGVSRSGYYAWRVRPPAARTEADAQLGGIIRQVHAASRGTYGMPRIHAELRACGVRCGRKRVARLLRIAGLHGCHRRKGTITTRRGAEATPTLDRVQRDFTAAAPNRLWVADITYIPTWMGFLYLAVVLDVFSRRVVGWAMTDGSPLGSMRAELVVDALDMAIARRRPEAGVIHHSDHGSQYTSLTFGQRLHDAGILASRGSQGDCYDNALMESFFATLECELLDGRAFPTHRMARTALFEFLEGFYNTQRRHSALNYLSPSDYERGWTSISQMA